MQFNITTMLNACLSDKGFSLDELVCRMDELYNKKGFPEIIRHVLMLYDDVIRLMVMQKNATPFSCDCGESCFVLDGRRDRTVKTSLGKVELKGMTRLKCKRCGRTIVPLMDICGIDRYQTKTGELEKLVLEQCAQTSYRRAAKTIRKTTGGQISYGTCHRWVLTTDADEIRVPDDVIASTPGTIFADGTKCKSIDEVSGHARRGDIKVLMGVRASGSVFPIGTWTHDETWQQISDGLKQNQVRFPDGTILVCDGESGLAESLAGLANRQQRCQWHIVRDTYHMMWQDGGRKNTISPIQERLQSIMAIELPKESFEKVPEEKKTEIERKTGAAEREVNNLIEELRQSGYQTAVRYLENARSYMFGYVRRWLALGIICPRASSLIERTMREIGRRVKKLAYNWKSDGLGKVTRLLLKIFSNEDDWDAFWRTRMNISQSVMLSFRLVKA